ncbi:MAG: penicillin-binding protein 2 [Sedimentisphaerales bacterium]|nr:penicillin-binding protein 2 [Sedimentisphaerales bacterium]
MEDTNPREAEQFYSREENKRSILIFALSVIFVLLLLVGRCFYIQFLKGPYYVLASGRQQQMLIPQRPQRGVILDCRGRIIAASNKIQTVFAEPRAIKNIKKVATELASILRMDSRHIYKLIEQSKNPGYVKIKETPDTNQCSAACKIHGIGVHSSWQRHYPVGPLAANTVGFTGTDNEGLSGIELRYDKQLRGSPGVNIFFADARPYRRPIRLKQQEGSPHDGMGIILTLDSTIQQFARAELLKQYQEYEAKSALAIVVEPKTGAILAMVSLPDFNPNNISSAEPNSFRNRVITDQFEPGSILKPIAMAIALEAGVVKTNETIFCENGHYLGKGFGHIKEYRYHKYGNLKLREILIKSSNIGMAKIGQKLGRKNLYRGLTLFGLGKKTGIDLPGEVSGLLRPVNQWTGYSVTRIPFGQEVSVTAIELVRAFCILANRGRYVRPYLVKAMVDSEGKVTQLKRPAPPIGFVVRPEVADWIVTDALVGVVNEKKNGGTGWRARLDKWQVFGKTGTAQMAKKKQKGYSENDYIASFVAGAPAEDPRIVVLVSICRPNRKLGKGYTGGAVASPVAAKIIEKTLNYLQQP